MENNGSGRGWEGVAEGYRANYLEREEIQRHNEL